MRHFAQAVSEMLRLSKLNIRCSDIKPDHARSLFRKPVKLRERKTKIEFDAFVTDYCSEDEFGFIVAFDKKVAKKLANQDYGPADSGNKNFVEMDLRKKFSGKEFDLIG